MVVTPRNLFSCGGQLVCIQKEDFWWIVLNIDRRPPLRIRQNSKYDDTNCEQKRLDHGVSFRTSENGSEATEFIHVTLIVKLKRSLRSRS